MLLNGVIDAAVMGGIGNYEKIFFNPSYLTEHPEDQERVKKLRSLIEEQVGLILFCEFKCPSDRDSLIFKECRSISV